MSEFRLMCNFTQCRKILTKSAYITQCSHIFCNEHGLNILMDDNLICSGCDMRLRSTKDIIRVNLNPDEETKSQFLVGLNPRTIMDVSGRALSFWSYQMNEENAFLEQAIKNATENVTALKDYCENLSVKCKKECEEKQLQVQTLKEELELNRKRCEDLIHQLQQKTELIQKIKNRKSASNTTLNQEDCDLDQILTPMSKTAYNTTPFNSYRVPNPEPSPIYNFILKPESMQRQAAQEHEIAPSQIFTPQPSSQFSMKNDDEPFVLSPINLSKTNREFNFSPNLD